MKKTVLVVIYDHPDKFPPTLNAIAVLSKALEKVIILYRDDSGLSLNFPQNCIVYNISSPNLLHSSLLIKLKTLITFIATLFKISIKHKPNWLLAYDLYSFFACNLVKRNLKSTKLWYHNHDVTDPSYIKKYSLSWILWKNEKYSLKKADLFSLPDVNRITYFNFTKNEIPFVEIPNYASLNFNPTFTPKKLNKIKILYQGRVAPGHGIKELINFISTHSELDLEFHIIGSYDENFKNGLKEIVNTFSLGEKIFLHDRIAHYHELKNFTKSFDIGLGIMEPLNIQLSTCAKASNKIYEYISFGMPVILLNTKNFRDVLGQHKWAFFTDMSDFSFLTIFNEIKQNYAEASLAAFNDYRTRLNFELNFEQVVEKINS